jgi:hypothetical protein
MGKIETTDEFKIEFELWIGLVFKPLRHHLKKIVEESRNFLSLWKTVLAILEELLSDANGETAPDELLLAMMELANEHLRNSIMVLSAVGVLECDSNSPDDITAITWDSVRKIDYCVRIGGSRCVGFA